MQVAMGGDFYEVWLEQELRLVEREYRETQARCAADEGAVLLAILRTQRSTLRRCLARYRGEPVSIAEEVA